MVVINTVGRNLPNIVVVDESVEKKYSNLETVLNSIVNMIQENREEITDIRKESSRNAETIDDLAFTPTKMLKANVVVLSEFKEGPGGYGSGSVIKVTDKRSYILTAAHVVSNVKYVQSSKGLGKSLKPVHTLPKTIQIVFDGKEKYVAMLVKIDYTLDVAVLRILRSLDVEPVKIARMEPNVGDKVWAISNPNGTLGVVNTGIFSTPEREASIVSIAGFFGSSGGMCLNSEGEQIGVISTVVVAQINKFMPSLTVYNQITRTQALNDFLKDILE
jgi:S1-C subfamily serine protease